MSLSNRLYQEIGNEIKSLLKLGTYKIGDRLPPERDIAETFGVSRTVVREALIMLELEKLVTVKKGSGVYVIGLPNQALSKETQSDDYGPFELLQARQLLESHITGFAALQITKNDIMALRGILEKEKQQLAQGVFNDYSADEQFHTVIARSTKNAVLEGVLSDLWQKRYTSKMWDTLHNRITDYSYRTKWLDDHEKILQALQLRDAKVASQAMWQHLENVKQTLMRVSDSEDPNFDGYLFESIPTRLVNV